MGLAVPTAVMVASGRGAAAGVLIKGGEPLERLAGVDTVVFDKTGTLTEGRPRSSIRWFAGDRDRDTMLAWSRPSESKSEHPLAKAIVAHSPARDRPLRGRQRSAHSPARASSAIGRRPPRDRRHPGAARRIRRSTPRAFDADGRRMDGSRRARSSLAAIDGKAAAAFAIADTLRPNARAVVAVAEAPRPSHRHAERRSPGDRRSDRARRPASTT